MPMRNFFTHHTVRQRPSAAGFTIFYAVLVTSLSLAIGLAIYDLTVRELQLSATASESQQAIYAADTGAECALYWDSKYGTVQSDDADGSAFATSTDYVHGGIATTGQAPCGGADIVGPAKTAGTWPIQTGSDAPSATAATSSFTVSVGGTNCAIVYVAKYGTPIRTTVTSYGFYNCAGGSPVERALQLTY